MRDVAAGSRFLPGPVWQQHGGYRKRRNPMRAAALFRFGRTADQIRLSRSMSLK